MRLLTYITPETKVLETYTLVELTPTGTSTGVKSFLFRPDPWDGNTAHIFLTFTPAGTVIQGPLVCGPEGKGFLCDKPYEWFISPRTAEELLSEFCQVTWQEQVAARDIRRLARSTPSVEKSEKLEKLAERVLRQGGSSGWLTCELVDMGYDPTTARDVGWDYPFADAGWVCAIQLYVSRRLRLEN